MDASEVTNTDVIGVPKTSPKKAAAKRPAKAVPAKPEPQIVASDALSGADDADTVTTLPANVRSSLADITAKAAAKKTLAPAPPASTRPSAPPPVPSSRPAPPAAVAAPPPSSRPAPTSVRPAPPPSSRPAPHSVRPPLSSTPAAFVAPVLQLPPPAVPTLRGFGPGGAPLAVGSSDPAYFGPPASSDPMVAPLPQPSTPKAFAPISSGPAPAAQPNVAYERAFRAWSSPNLGPSAEEEESGPLSFQVYRPTDLAAPRPVSLSRIAEESAALAPRPSLASRFALVAAALLTVLGTAGLISFASSEDAPARVAAAKPRAALVAPSAPMLPSTSTTTTTAVDVPVAPAPAPTVIVVASPKPVAAPKAPAPEKSAKPLAVKAAPTARASGEAASVPAPPPNPYGGTPSSVLRPPPGFKP